MRTAVALFCAGIALYLFGLGWGWLALSLPFGAWLALYAIEYLWNVPIWLIDRLCQDGPSRSGAAINVRRAAHGSSAARQESHQ